MSNQDKSTEQIAKDIFGYCLCLDMMRLSVDNFGDIHTSNQNRLATIAHNQLMKFINSKDTKQHKGE